MFEHVYNFPSEYAIYCSSGKGGGEKKLFANFYFFSSSFCAQPREPPSQSISLSSLPLWFSSHNRLPLRAPRLKGTEVVGGQIRFRCNNGNSIRKWRGGGSCRVGKPGLHFSESSRPAGREVRPRSRTRGGSAGREEDREVRHPPRQPEEDV